MNISDLTDNEFHALEYRVRELGKPSALIVDDPNHPVVQQALSDLFGAPNNDELFGEPAAEEAPVVAPPVETPSQELAHDAETPLAEAATAVENAEEKLPGDPDLAAAAEDISRAESDVKVIE